MGEGWLWIKETESVSVAYSKAVDLNGVSLEKDTRCTGLHVKCPS